MLESRVVIGLVAAAIPVPMMDGLAAATAQATLAVSATVAPSCNVRVSPLHFDGAAGANARRDAEALIAVGCTPEAAYSVAIDDGENAAGGQRRMIGGSGDFLAYEIYRDPARTRRWGAGADAASGVMAAGGSAHLAAYARIADREDRAGSYRDTVTVTVSF